MVLSDLDLVPQGLVQAHSHQPLPEKQERIMTGFSSHKEAIPRGHLLVVGNLAQDMHASALGPELPDLQSRAWEGTVVLTDFFFF